MLNTNNNKCNFKINNAKIALVCYTRKFEYIQIVNLVFSWLTHSNPTGCLEKQIQNKIQKN